MQRDLRVHVAGLGYEVRRLVEPAIDMRADRVYVLTDPPDARLRPYHDGVIARLEAAGVEVRVQEGVVWDPNAVVGLMGRIAHEEVGNHIYVNLGTGPKTCAIAGMLAAMLWNLDAYYPSVDYTVPEAELPLPKDHPVKGVTFVPTFRLDPPGHDVLAALQLLGEREGRPVRKKELVGRLRDHGHIPADASAQAAQNKADRVLKRALEWGFLDTAGEGRRRRLRINERGEAGLKMFSHLPTRAADEWLR